MAQIDHHIVIIIIVYFDHHIVIIIIILITMRENLDSPTVETDGKAGFSKG